MRLPTQLLCAALLALAAQSAEPPGGPSQAVTLLLTELGRSCVFNR